MERKLLLILLFTLIELVAFSQNKQETTSINGYMVPICIYQGDTIPSLRMPTLYVFKSLNFKNERQRKEYNRLVRNVKKTLPIAKEVNRIIIETYEYLQT